MNALVTPTQSEIRFVYAKNKSGRHVTVGYVYDDNDNVIRISKAECSKRDQFVKKIGRAIVSGRLTTHGGTAIPYGTIGGTKYGQIASYLVSNVDSL